MKKTLSLLFALTFAVSVLCLTAAASTKTVDIYTGETLTGTVGEEDSVKYVFDSDDDGFAVIKLLSVSSVDSASPTVSVTFNAGGKQTCSFESDKTFDGEKYVIIEGVKAGENSFTVTNTTKFSTVDYSVSFEFKRYDYVEYEYNDTPEKATPLSFSKSYTGGVLRDDEEDWFSFDMAFDGFVSIAMSNDKPKIYTLFDADKRSLGTVSFELKDPTKSYTQRFCIPKGKYYFRVMNYDDMSYPKYSFRIAAYSGENFETEYNDTMESADSVRFSTEYKGNLSWQEDADLYKFTLSETDEVSISFSDSVTSKSGHYSLYILDKDGNDIAKNELTGTAVLAQKLEKGTYYFKVMCPAEKYYSGASYSFRIGTKLLHNDAHVSPTEPVVPSEPDVPSEPVIVPEAPELTVPVFVDVVPGAWYYDYVGTAHYLKLVEGVGDDRFEPDGKITLAQALTMASRLHKDKNGVSFDFDADTGSVWYANYVIYAISAGLIKTGDFASYDSEATRAQVAYIFANALEEDAQKLNDVKAIPDVDENTKYYDSIFGLYNAGITAGNDDSGTFLPDNPISRAEVTAMLVRLYDKDLRVKGESGVNKPIKLPGGEVSLYPEDDEEKLSPKVYEMPSENGLYENDSFGDKLNALMPQDKDYMFSPVSIRMAFAMAANGADGDTKAELCKAMGIEDLDKFNSYARALISNYGKASFLRLNVSNSIWLNTDVEKNDFRDSFKSTISDFYNGDIGKVTNANAVETINSWASQKTNERIKKVIDTPDFNGCLVNAVYFKASWLNEFHTVVKEDFTSWDKSVRSVDMMLRTDYARYAKEGDTQIISLPYMNYSAAENGFDVERYNDLDISMYVLLSDEKVENPVETVRNAKLSSTYVELHLPKFESRFSTDLTGMMSKLGADKAFDKAAADFSQMFDSDAKYYLTGASHDTFIKVDEKGTEAAAVTVLMAGATAVQEKPKPVVMDVNKPFTYVIYDNNNNEALFVGSIVAG